MFKWWQTKRTSAQRPRPIDLRLEVMEERLVPSWSSTPPATITPPSSYTSVTLNSSGDATGNASITNNEIDWYRFTATTGGTYVFQATTPSSSLDTVIATYTSAGSRVGYNDDISSSNTDSRFTVTLTAGAVYYFGVTNYTGTAGGSYTWLIDGPATITDDAYEENDSLAAAYNLGTLTSNRQITGLQMRDAADWFRFTTSFTGTTSHSVSISFTHSQGDLDLKLYNASGTQIGASTGTGNSETISLNGRTAGTYYVQVYGYQGVQNPNYTLTITPPSSGGATGNKTLYLNFDGATITRTDLVRWAGSYWDPNSLDSDANGITVQAFLRNRTDRETIINQIISMVQTDLNAYGMTVRRHTGLAVEGQGATTIFLGPATLTGGGYHIACDIDYGNNNPTDIAFVGDEDWGSASSTAITMADVTLHEAGHTFGLWHVASGTALESMGLRYNTPQSQWVQDTRFLDQTFSAYVSGGVAHGPGPQNSHQTMLAWSGGGGAGGGGGGSSSNISLVDTSGRGVFRITGSADADRITIERIGRYDYRVNINGQSQYVFGPTLREFRVITNGDARDQVVALNNLGRVRLTVDTRWDGSIRNQAKIDDQLAEMWRGNRHGGGCGCAACSAAAAALNGQASGLVMNELDEDQIEQMQRYQQLGQALIVPATPRWSLGQPSPDAKIQPNQSYAEWKNLVLNGATGAPTNAVQPKTTAANDWSAGFSGFMELQDTDSYFSRIDARLI